MKVRVSGLICLIRLQLLRSSVFLVPTNIVFHAGALEPQTRKPANVWFFRPRENRHYLVNGDVLPSIDLTSGSWVRFRMAFAGHGNSHAISILDPDGDCEMGVLAKDGVYLAEVPREEAKLFFTAASR